MVYLTTDELRETTKKRGIRDYEKMPRAELLRTFDESECFIKNLLQNVQNLSGNEIKQVIKMLNLSRNKLEQIAKKEVLKNTRIYQKKDY